MGQRRVSAPLGAAGLLRPGAWTEARLAWRLLRDPRVASKLKVAVPVLAALYVVSPIDLLPDFLLGLGQVDDLGVIGVAVVFLLRVLPRLAPTEVLDEHLAAMGLREPAKGAIETEFRVRR